MSEIRQSIRGLSRRPLFSSVVVLTLALGIGATTAIFSAFWHTLVRPLPFADADRLAWVWLEMRGGGMLVTPERRHFDAWRAATSFEVIEPYTQGEFTLAGAEPEFVQGGRITGTLPGALGVEPIVGRTFAPEEMVLGGPNVAILGESLWRSRFGGRRDVLGETIEMRDGTRHEIVGVLPDRFATFTGFGDNGRLWLPYRPEGEDARASVVVRLRDGVTFDAASAELARITDEVTGDDPQDAVWQPALHTADSFINGTVQRGLPLVFAGVAAVLLIACANIAGLLLLRLAGRGRELAVRTALGASRSRIARLVATDSMLLALLGGLTGVLLALALTKLVRDLRPASLSSLDAISLDATALVFAAGITLLAAVFFGFVPVLLSLRADPSRSLASGGGATARTSSGTRVRSVLVTGQIALSMVLLVGALLLVRSVASLRSSDLGFEPAGVTAMRVPIGSEDRYSTPEARRLFFDQLVVRIDAIPGVEQVTVSSGVPTRAGIMGGQLSIRDRELTDGERPAYTMYTGVSPSYFATLHIPLREGRLFNDSDRDDVVIINESWARQLWPDGSAVGRQIRFGITDDAPWSTVVGVVADVATNGPAVETVRPHVYEPLTYRFGESVAFRTAPGAADVVPAVRDAVRAIDPDIILRDIASMSDMIAATIALDNFYMVLLTAFAGLAVVLTLIGLYGVIGRAVTARTQEIGIRLALGARPASVRVLVLRQALLLTAVGLVIGVIIAYNAVQLLASSLHGVESRDAFSFTSAAALLAVGATIAALIPARRAVRIDPLTALRSN